MWLVALRPSNLMAFLCDLLFWIFGSGTDIVCSYEIWVKDVVWINHWCIRTVLEWDYDGSIFAFCNIRMKNATKEIAVLKATMTNKEILSMALISSRDFYCLFWYMIILIAYVLNNRCLHLDFTKSESKC